VKQLADQSASGGNRENGEKELKFVGKIGVFTGICRPSGVTHKTTPLRR